MTQIKKTRDPSNNDELEARILHWERQLSDSLKAVYVAQIQLEKIYNQRYESIVKILGHTSVYRRIISEIK